MKILLRLFLFIFPIINAKIIQSNRASTCIYAFTDPFYPSFTLPPAQPNSPGDVQLNKNNPIRLANGSNLAVGQGCNSRTFSYYETSSEQFLTTYIDVNRQNSSIVDIIYATNHDQLYVRTIQLNQANLASFLAGKILKIDLNCNNGLLGCAYFTVESSSSNTLPTILTSGSISSQSIISIIMLNLLCMHWLKNHSYIS
ncbi:unnamed protein product [Rotaria sordida]|uniref:Uncharacterized protein n=1 Tax=Rotaria sordida TaxID=392033 RepID=A0A814LJE5_9BILA|nr:unnamed protein product [Rotaria sordida]CAF1058958.1 unnamed protein product [Rotaria sordida]CAF1066605.1 unnamed protein product [Rotaria sordida]